MIILEIFCYVIATGSKQISIIRLDLITVEPQFWDEPLRLVIRALCFVGKAGRSVTFVDDDDRKLVKEILKQKIKLQERVIPPALVKKWWNKIEQLTPAIENLVYVSSKLVNLITEAKTVFGIDLGYDIVQINELKIPLQISQEEAKKRY